MFEFSLRSPALGVGGGEKGGGLGTRGREEGKGEPASNPHDFWWLRSPVNVSIWLVASLPIKILDKRDYISTSVREILHTTSKMATLIKAKPEQEQAVNNLLNGKDLLADIFERRIYQNFTTIKHYDNNEAVVLYNISVTSSNERCWYPRIRFIYSKLSVIWSLPKLRCISVHFIGWAKRVFVAATALLCNCYYRSFAWRFCGFDEATVDSKKTSKYGR